MIRNVTPTVALAAALMLAACEKPKPEAPAPQVTYTTVVKQDVTATGTWVGLLDGFQNANIQAQVTGYLLTQNYKEGSFVQKGTVLFTIDPRPFQAALAQAQADYAKAVAQAQLQQITLQRQTQLFQTKVISQQEYDTSFQDNQAAIAAEAAAQANVQAAQVNLDYCTIKAPFDGIVGVAQAQIGDLVGPGGRTAVLTEISQLDPMKMNFAITESEYLQAADLLARLQSRSPDQKTEGRLTLRLADGSEYPAKGAFDFVNRQVSSSTGTIQITALFPNPQGILRPGLFARVTGPVQEIPGALLVPQASIAELQGNQFVITLTPDNVAKPVFVKPGPTEGPLQVVKGALQEGMRIVVGGVEKARPGTKVNASPYQTPPAASPSPAAAGTPSPTPAP